MNSKQDGLKFIFSLVSLCLMLPAFLNDESGFYGTLFIFLINRVIDIFFKDKGEGCFFIIWGLINQWVGVVACAIAFSHVMPEFAEICKPYAVHIKQALFLTAVSCVMREMVWLIVISVKEDLIKKKINKETK